MFRVSFVGGRGREASGGNEGGESVFSRRVERGGSNSIVVACCTAEEIAVGGGEVALGTKTGIEGSLVGGSNTLSSFCGRGGNGCRGSAAGSGSYKEAGIVGRIA